MSTQGRRLFLRLGAGTAVAGAWKLQGTNDRVTLALIGGRNQGRSVALRAIQAGAQLKTFSDLHPAILEKTGADIEAAQGKQFLHTADAMGLNVIARLKDNLPELLAAAEKRFRSPRPWLSFWDGEERVEIWDAGDFDPWETLRWGTVRVIRYRQHKPNGQVIEAYWLTNFSSRRVGSRSLNRVAKSRWEIENQGFNDAKNRYGLRHVCHHQPNSLLLQWLITALALTIERLYQLRYLHRGTHGVQSSWSDCFGSVPDGRWSSTPVRLAPGTTTCSFSI
ncbi:MAG: transposase [Bryobacteraceae bacterium]|jgi:hypothetical protein